MMELKTLQSMMNNVVGALNVRKRLLEDRIHDVPERAREILASGSVHGVSNADVVVATGCSTYPDVDAAIAAIGTCPDGTVAIPAPLPLDPSVTPADNHRAAWRATLFFGASTRGILTCSVPHLLLLPTSAFDSPNVEALVLCATHSPELAMAKGNAAGKQALRQVKDGKGDV